MTSCVYFCFRAWVSADVGVHLCIPFLPVARASAGASWCCCCVVAGLLGKTLDERSNHPGNTTEPVVYDCT